MALWLGLAAHGAAAGAACRDGEFVIDDVVVSDPQISIVDPEFDQQGARFVWQDGAGDVWSAAVDRASGEFLPASGMGTLVASGAAPLARTLNGPEWAFGADGTFILYTRSVGGRLWLAAAREIAPGKWFSTLLGNGVDRFSPTGTVSANETTPARITYFSTSGRQLVTQYRELLAPASERVIPLPEVRGARWVEDQPQIVASALFQGEEQVFLYETDADEARLAGLGGPRPKAMPFAWMAPELGEMLIVAALSGREVVIYRLQPSGRLGVWYRFALPSERRFINSIEPFVWDGRSWIVAVAAEQSEAGLGGRPGGPADIWIAGIDPQRPFFRKISAGERDTTIRLDPEPFVLQDRPVVYYTELSRDRRAFVQRRAETGLAGCAPPPSAR